MFTLLAKQKQLSLPTRHVWDSCWICELHSSVIPTQHTKKCLLGRRSTLGHLFDAKAHQNWGIQSAGYGLKWPPQKVVDKHSYETVSLRVHDRPLWGRQSVMLISRVLFKIEILSLLFDMVTYKMDKLDTRKDCPDKCQWHMSNKRPEVSPTGEALEESICNCTVFAFKEISVLIPIPRSSLQRK